MRLILRYPNGRTVEALLLARSAAALRIIERGRGDTVELTLVAGACVDQDGRRVSIEAILPAPGPRAAHAGSAGFVS